MNIAICIKKLYPSAIGGIDYCVIDNLDGTGQYIDSWDEAKLGPKPTLDVLSQVEQVAIKEQKMLIIIAIIQKILDSQALLKGYYNIISACSYASQPPGAPFQAEGVAFTAWRSAVWTKAYSMLAEIESGAIAIPSPEEIASLMPDLILPGI